MHVEQVRMSWGLSWALVEDDNETAQEISSQEAAGLQQRGVPLVERPQHRGVGEFERFFADTIG